MGCSVTDKGDVGTGKRLGVLLVSTKYLFLTEALLVVFKIASNVNTEELCSSCAVKVSFGAVIPFHSFVIRAGVSEIFRVLLLLLLTKPEVLSDAGSVLFARGVLDSWVPLEERAIDMNEVAVLISAPDKEGALVTGSPSVTFDSNVGIISVRGSTISPAAQQLE